jgi:diadenosine tetraphosphate (Ap4A) HIT family hydrolase
MSYTCGVCGFELWHFIAQFDASVVGLVDDDRFPGRCIVVLREHYDHLDEVPPALAGALFADAAAVGRVLRSELGATRVNYAALGNTDPHTHVHVIPRYATDPLPNKPPWEDPRAKGPLGEAKRARLQQLLAGGLR